MKVHFSDSYINKSLKGSAYKKDVMMTDLPEKFILFFVLYRLKVYPNCFVADIEQV